MSKDFKTIEEAKEHIQSLDKRLEEARETIRQLANKLDHEKEKVKRLEEAVFKARKFLETFSSNMSAWYSVARTVIYKYESDPNGNPDLKDAYHQQRGIQWVIGEARDFARQMMGALYPFHVNKPESNEEF